MAPQHNYLVAISILLSSVVTLSSAQYFAIEPQDAEILQGYRIVMQCRLLERPPGTQLYWQIPAIANRFIGPGYMVPTDYANKYQITGNEQLDDYNLVINSATEEDEGAYRCILFQDGRGDGTNPTQIASSRVAELIVATLNASGKPDCWASPRRQVHVGDDIELKCASSDEDLDLVWTQDSNVLPSSSGASTTIPTLVETSFTAEASMDGQIFKCSSPSASNQQCQVVITVTSPPVVTIEPVGSLKTGRDGRFRCSATGNPSVFVYSWKYGDNIVGNQYNRRFNNAGLEEKNDVLVLPDLHTDDDGVILECIVINEHGEGVGTFPIRVAIEDLTALIAPILCAIVVAIIILLLIGFCCWRSHQRKAMEQIAEGHKISHPIDTEMNGHVNTAFTSFSPLDVDSVGYGPDVEQPYPSRPSNRNYDSGEPKPIPRLNSETRSKGGSESGVGDVDEEETQTYTYHVNPHYEDYRNSYDVNSALEETGEKGAFFDDDDDFQRESPPLPLPQNNLDLEKKLRGDLDNISEYKNFDDDSEAVIVSTEL